MSYWNCTRCGAVFDDDKGHDLLTAHLVTCPPLPRAPRADPKAAERRRHLLARMAGNIAAGLAASQPPPAEREHQWEVEVAYGAVAIAREILAELEADHGS